MSRHTTSKLNANANVVPSASSSKPPSSTAKSTTTTQSKPGSSPSPTKSSSTTTAPKPTTPTSNKPSSTSSPAKSTSTAVAPKPSTSTQTVKEAGSSSSSVKPPSTLPSPTKTTSSSPVPTKTTPASSPAKSSSTASAPKPTATTQTVMGAGNSPTSSAKPDASPSPTKSTSILPSVSSKPDASPSPTKSTSVLPSVSSKPDASASPTKSTSIVSTSSSKPTATSQSVKISGTSLPPPPSGSPNPSDKPTATSQTTATASGEASAPGYNGVPPGPGAYLYSDPSQLAEPQVLTSANGFLNITLTVKVARFTGFISFNSRQYSCNGIAAIPGPTWNITAGDTVTLTLINELEANNDADDLVDMTLMNTMHSPNSTNMHTHGLHVSSSQDNVFQRIYPGESFQYTYTIPDDHAPGLHWYHSHKHGTSAFQVMGGLVGAIYVRPTEAAVKESTALTYLAGLERHVLVGQHFAMESINTNTDPFTVRTYEYLSSLLKSQVPINAEYVNSSVKDIYFINGQFQPKLAMMPGTPVVLDIVNAVGDVVIELDIRDSPQASSVSSSCSLVQIASDGIYFTSVRTLGYVAMVPGNRVSIIIQCTKPGTFYLTNMPDDSLRPGITDNETRFQQSMVTLVVGGTETTEFTSYSSLDLSTIVRPTQLKDTLNTVVTSKWELSVEQEPGSTRPITGIGMGSECGIESTDSNCQYLSFPGELSTTGPYRHITYVGAVDELIINGRGKSAHSVHIHVNHFQVVSDQMFDDGQRYFYRIGDWRDTIPAVPGRVKVRQNVQDFSGEVVVHCHFLMHEDMGMMATYYVRPANESSKGYCTYPGGTGTSGSCALSDGVVLSSATLSAAATKTNSPGTSK
ncbi:hypothetical protein HDU78_010131 [Chytriomyces hyalinus]|nr:hypothetical protein HDU78_010131 [Chytriomyces hyalinus]